MKTFHIVHSLALLVAFAAHGHATSEEPDYLIVGAGSGGLQMALYFEKFGFSYKILEKKDVVGSHFKTFPRFGELISLNKWVRNETQKMRYDWHTLLEAPLEMRDVTKDYFPQGKDWHRYMTLVAEKAGILPKIEFGVEVDRVATNDRPCLILMDGTERCAKRRLLIGTGLKEKKEPLLEALGGIPYSQVTKEMATERRVCILGNGNSAFELAQNVYQVAERVILYGKRPIRLSSVTRYTGDVRVKYLQILENLNMKQLDTVDYFLDGMVSHQGLEKHLNQSQIELVEEAAQVVSWMKDYECETLFMATGFKSSIPGGLTMDSRFPLTLDWYESVDNSKVHFIGWLMHERDFRVSAGGFLSGFRYLVRNLAYHIREEDAGVSYPHVVLKSKDEVVAKVSDRLQVADDIFLLQDGAAIRDVIVPNKDETGTYTYYEGITHEFHRDLDMDTRNDIVSVYFEWGKRRHSAMTFEQMVRYPDQKLINAYLHGAIEVNGLVRQVQEDVLLEHVEAYQDAAERVVRAALDADLKGFVPQYDQKHNPWKAMEVEQTEFNYYESASPPAGIDPNVGQAIAYAVRAELREREVKQLRGAMEQWYPSIFEPHKLKKQSVVVE